MTTSLLSNRTTDVQTGVFESRGRYITLVASGTWDGAVLNVQVSPDGGTTWIASEVSLTADGIKNFILGRGILCRLDLGSSGATTSVSAWVAFEA